MRQTDESSEIMSYWMNALILQSLSDISWDFFLHLCHQITLTIVIWRLECWESNCTQKNHYGESFTWLLFCPTNIGGDFYPTPIVLMINGKSYRSYRLHHSLLVAFTWQKLTANDILLYFDWFSKSIWFFFHLFICYHSASVWWWRWFSLEIFVCWHQHYSSYSIIQLFCLPMCTTWVWACVYG